MKTINTQRQFGKRKAFSAILITLVLVGAGLGMTFAAIFTLTDVFESSSSVVAVSITNPQLRVLGSDSYLTMNIKNVGTDAIVVQEGVLLVGVVASSGNVAAGVNPSVDMITTDITLSPGETASVKGKITCTKALADCGSTVDRANVALSKGENYLIQIDGHIGTTTGEPIIETASIRAR